MPRNRNRYDIIIPFGRCCHTAMVLNDLGLRKCSLPFDWLVDSEDELDDINIRFKLFEDISSFLQTENMEYFRDKSFEDPNHYLAVDNKYKIALWHDFDIKNPDKQNLVLTRFKYQKRHKRFLKIIENMDKFAFIHIVNTYDRIHEYNQKVDIKCIIENINELHRKYPNKIFDFYVFENNFNLISNEIKVKEFCTKYKSKVYNIISNHSITNETGNPMDITSIKSVLSKLELSGKLSDEDIK